MSFAKSFGLSLLIFIGLNVVFFFIGTALIDGGLDLFFTNLEDELSVILEPLFGPIYSLMGPESILNRVLTVSDLELGDIVLMIGYVVAPLIAAIMAGVFAENKIEALLGWFLAVMVGAVFVLSWRVYVLSDMGQPGDYIVDYIIYTAVLGGIIGIFYGCFALLFTSSEYF
ncbi:MAG: hypothetical protein ACFE8L_06485 [Candidatus Hodarchaeota archaeon]